ncbi:xylitol dehydrogenase, zinc-containing alcohol dehydrogenase superfamily [Azotobacter vinelandii CA]|uniref:Xylitol dehydrogenase, zinc-containing alcohol dehydrogenase superfamily n=3 Tax=Azotobacter vinelandii TaxID=354 RepID=C1DSB7_AZOVD|nr:NAD(P)-dependent alcohol dehydrogenase [Azotobacter vinelandii]ACO77872.1 xylitol dehydrogenase, zinc-containing alcohol dehydrogenase superfamily [Azotobacter vinelandii DJ]AGK15244.1 xylitol dehydrogenase, zinc-containing alcohol dehydrogenase superfamily [Azotobacter vinelandii CA]AGK20038.1 xylitol dehydrogenase, zinc-containing alcohol dehydrogenase superfamily [Azotobacter vinelandii CA6]SFY30748.1 D-xylulose reductase [Azotobacter vinelandii]GLK60150.1 putative D-xylulose reductase [
MKALVLEKQHDLKIRDIDLPLVLGPDDVRIRIHTVGVCGSDVHYYTHGRIGHFIVDQPMVLGHEAAGTVIEVGSNVTHLAKGDRVCMEPGIPNPRSKASRLGLYNVDPSVVFWATPPVHGCLTPEVVHPAAFAYKLPDHVSFAEGALVEPFAIGMQAAVKARIKPGDVAVVIGAGTIGMMTALAALAGGASQVLVSDLMVEKLAIAQRYEGITAVNVREQSLQDKVAEATGGWGADVVFEASGSARAYGDALAAVCPGGALVLVGMPVEPVLFDVVAAQAKEIRIETVFRYANVYERAVNLIASGKVDLKPLISATFPFERGVEAFERAASAQPGDVKVQITFGDA